ncbi:MAG: hypothetical protein K1W30_10280 [Lachnospiraceae bacterium]
MGKTEETVQEPLSQEEMNYTDEAVAYAKRDEEWRLAYMTYQANQRDAELRGEIRGDERRAKEYVQHQTGCRKDCEICWIRC